MKCRSKGAIMRLCLVNLSGELGAGWELRFIMYFHLCLSLHLPLSLIHPITARHHLISGQHR